MIRETFSVTLIALTLAACDPVPPEDRPTTVPISGGGDVDGYVGGAGDARPGGRADPTSERDVVQRMAQSTLSGRLIIASVDDPEPRGVVDAFDPVSGERTRLWATGPETSAWSMAPDGLLVAYLASVREPSEIERLVIRALAVGAEERIVSGNEAAVSRFAGYSWSADGKTIAAIRQIGFPGSQPDADARWELALLAVADGDEFAESANERVIWSVAAAETGGVALSLAAWDSTSGRAVVLESGLDGGPVVALRVIDTVQGSELMRQSIAGAGEGFRASSDGTHLAWIRIDNGAIVVFHLADATHALEVPSDTEVVRDNLVWSDDAGRLAWREDGAPGLAAETRVVVAEVGNGGSLQVHALSGRALRPLAFSPDDDSLLVGVGLPEGIETSELHFVAPMSDAEPSALGWTAPAGRWGLSWVP